MLDRVRSWLSGQPFGLPGTTGLNALLAVVLSVGVVLAASGSLDSTDPQGGFWVSAAALLMTVPVAWRRRQPLVVIAALAAGAVFNWLVAGSYVRCGAALPALFLALFSVADDCELGPSLAGGALGLVSAIAQAHSDPQLKGFTIGACVLTAMLWGAGRLVRSRKTMMSALRERTDVLHEQREATSRLAVAADRAQVARDLDGAIGQRLGRLAADATAARDAVSTEPAAARESLAAIEHEGRQTLNEMREIVGALRDESPIRPHPSLNDVAALLDRIGSSASRLTVIGDRTRLPAGVELSAFRIIERLLEPLETLAGARAAVELRYAPEMLEVRVQGTVRSEADMQTTLAAAREWVSLHAGALESEVRAGVSRIEVRLPLVAAHA
jgi:signal transduction histidine kinase